MPSPSLSRSHCIMFLGEILNSRIASLLPGVYSFDDLDSGLGEGGLS